MKKPFNKNKRLRIYKQMLVDIPIKERAREDTWLEHSPVGFCLLLYIQQVYGIDSLEFFPELMKYKPKDLVGVGGLYWFEYKKINPRIKILKTIIKEMEGESKKK
jgi:hypothetical protein